MTAPTEAQWTSLTERLEDSLRADFIAGTEDAVSLAANLATEARAWLEGATNVTAPTPALRTILESMRDEAAETAQRTADRYYLGREDALTDVLDLLDRLGATS